MAGYTKLFSSIVTSTIWREPDHVRLVWVTMLALADRGGMVEASVPGLADMARVSRQKCDEALKVLSEPDVDSRTKELGGRRIMQVDGGWLLVNHGKYREKITEEDKRAKNAAYMRDYRLRVSSVIPSKVELGRVVQAEAEAAPDPKAVRSDSSEPPPAVSEPPLLTFACAGLGKKEFGLTQSMVDAWSDAWPGVDVLAEAKKARVWIEANPTKRKTYRGMPAFLTRWCSKAQDNSRLPGVASMPVRDIRGADYCVWHQRHQNDGTVSRYPKVGCPGCKTVADAESERVHAASVAKIMAERARKTQ